MTANDTAIPSLERVLGWSPFSSTPSFGFVTASPWWTALFTVVALVATLHLLIRPSTPQYTAEVRNLPGPKLPWFGWLLGNMVELAEHRDTVMHPDWIKMGWVGRYRSIFAMDRIWIIDPVALQYIFQHPDAFARPNDMRTILGQIMGKDGLAVIDGDQHRRLRRVLNPAFSTGEIRDKLPVIYDKAFELQALMDRLIEDDELELAAAHIPPAPVDRVPGARKIDMLKFAGWLTTDVLGRTGFGHDFESLAGANDDGHLSSTFTRMTNAAHGMAIITEAQNAIPILDKIPTHNRKEIAKAREEMERYSDVRNLSLPHTNIQEFVDKRKNQLAAEGPSTDKDLLTLLVQASTGIDPKMNDTEVRAQMAALLFAGSTTTAAAISSALYRLALHPDIQRRLRAEIEAVGEDRPSFETLNGLPLLDGVVRETLRLDSPVSCTCRIATRDMVVPLSRPVRGRDGTLMESLPVSKGTYFFMSMACLNRLTEVWGPDADEYNPYRHLDPTLPKMAVPGVWGHVSSFINGPHHCIGYRLAVAEIKVVLYTLLRMFEFEELPSKPKVVFLTSIATRSEVKGEAGGQLPLLVRPLASRE